ncbi:hypothetical protein PEX1_097770 [Penicillium expansum]|uniref:Uncharacterized protein n=1 Tax=Penicillium expansum TaxID=27334 RepID=A0A0A2KE50_PENEN|nr:hypothetical protein PEX2_053870 [Penicillium expansum]KGO48057.1 hypothetical protein PEXP_039210 [Penicillium expansum]KGO59809.1 hypothetical protein PEX2_053870 [Penicillium expansum]KGO65203.1 hypothetical protein PEX1_097770 [Penicillium expansum]
MRATCSSSRQAQAPRPLICRHPLCDPLRHIPHSPITRVMPVLQKLRKRGLSRI